MKSHCGILMRTQPWLAPFAAVSLSRKVHTCYANLSSNEVQVWRFLRHMYPRKRRWFFEGCIEIPGQLWLADREALYETVRSTRPEVVFEVGTWRGGGSTFFISQALYENGAGILHTTDIDCGMVQQAERAYARHLPHLTNHVHFHCGASADVYPDVLSTVPRIDLLFLDGQEDGDQTYSEFQLFEPYLSDGSLLLAHDWFSEKMVRLKPHIENSHDWEIIQVFKPSKSVGFVVARHR